MQKIWDLLDGKKRIIGTLIVFVAGGLRAINVLDDETAKMVVGFGGSVILFGLGAAMQKRNQ